MLRILFSGDGWHGSNARSCAEALRRIGCDVLVVDPQTFLPQANGIASRGVRRLLWPGMVRELNRSMLNCARNFRPDIFVAFKGHHIYGDTLRWMRSKKIALYNYFPDTSAFNHGKWLPRSLPEYDCIFYTKPFWYADAIKRISLRAGRFLPHGYDPALHRVLELSDRDRRDYSCDVSFIATHSYYKERLLNSLLSLRPNLDLRIWGDGWKSRCRSQLLQRCVQGFFLLGECYVRAIQAATINLGIMNGPVTGASSGDQTTSRTFTIPASGGFMLHERNAEVLELYREGEEMACFETVEELAEKIDSYLTYPRERERIAQAGHERCVPAYSYDRRMSEVLRWHQTANSA